MIVLLSGSLRAEILDRAGEPVPVARILPGTLVGEIGLYAGVPRTASVVAEEPCRLLGIARDALDRWRARTRRWPRTSTGWPPRTSRAG